MREPATKVAFTIEPYGNLVKLTVTHEGFIEGSKLVGAISNGMAGDPLRPQEHA